MQLTIDCPNCGVQLNVPEAAAGRRARCPSCQTKFVIPSVTDLLEETISHWIVEDVDAEKPESAAGAARVDASAAASSGDGTLMGVPAVDGAASRKSDEAGHVTATTPPAEPATAPVSPPPSTKVEEPPALQAEPTASPPPTPSAPPPPSASPLPPTPPPPPSAPSQRSAPVAPVASGASGGQYPSQFPASDRPHLLVQDSSQIGVALAFESKWVSHEAFRASMPVRCAVTGTSKRDNLTMRPMVFIEHFSGKDRSSQMLEQRYERRPGGVQSIREAVNAMDPIDGMAPPFDRPPVFFIAKDHASTSLRCKSTPREDGSFVCKVVIPDPRVAIEWLGRVNGICGIEYELLEKEIAMIGSDAWVMLPEKCRERLAVWCRFQPREQFQLYINDIEFTKADAGLAGVVVTDRRLIYHKYHHSGEVSLNDEATLHVKRDGVSARMAVEAKGRIGRVGKINQRDVPKLIEVLSGAPNLKIQMA